MPRISRKQIAKKREADKKSADEEQKKKKKKKLPTTLKECFESVDAGSIVLIASYLDIPPEPISANETNEGAEKSNAKKRKKEGQKKKKEGPKLETDAQEFGCIPWRLSLVHQLRKDGNGGYSNHILKLALHSEYRKDVAWRADISGTLTMKKWLEKMPEGTNPRKLNEHSENFTTTFTQSCQMHAFSTEFPLPIGGNAFASSSGADSTAKSANDNSSGLAPTTTKNDAKKLADSAANANDDTYLKNRQFKFELNFLINNVEFSHTPKLDFRKNQPSCNAVINIGTQKIYVNKEYLSIYSPVFATMFSAEGFVESAQQAATLRDVSPSAFNELMQLIYDPVRQPDGNFRFFNDLLKIARCYLIQYITNRCEKRLLLMDNDEKTISVGDRMKLAEEYDLVLLKARLIVKNDADELLKLDGIISEETRQMLLRKKNVTAEEEAAEAKRKQEEEEEKNAKKMEVDGKQGTSATAAGNGRGRGSARRRGGRRGGTNFGRGRGHGDPAPMLDANFGHGRGRGDPAPMLDANFGRGRGRGDPAPMLDANFGRGRGRGDLAAMLDANFGRGRGRGDLAPIVGMMLDMFDFGF